MLVLSAAVLVLVIDARAAGGRGWRASGVLAKTLSSQRGWRASGGLTETRRFDG